MKKQICNNLAQIAIAIVLIILVILIGGGLLLWWILSNLVNIAIGLTFMLLPIVLAVVCAILIKKYLLKK